MHGVKKSYSVHRLVALAFLNNPENKPCVNHIDGNKSNNNVNNLEWCTYSENAVHSAYVLGNNVGGKCYMSKITNDDALWIRENYKPFDPESGRAALAKKFNVHESTITAIVYNKTYKNI